MVKCRAYKDFSNTITDILLFGLITKVLPYTEPWTTKAENKGMKYYCDCIDREGNIYKVYTDYDPCLKVSRTIAFLTDMKEGNLFP